MKRSEESQKAAKAKAPVNTGDWVRFPYRNDTVNGLKRGKLARLAVPSKANKFKPPVLSMTVKEPGQKRATRLVNLPSLNAYLVSLATAQAEEASKLASAQ